MRTRTRNATRSRRAPDPNAAPAAPAPAPAGADAPARPRRRLVTVASLTAPEPLLHTIGEAQAMLRVGRTSIYKLISEGRLEIVNVTGDTTRITGASIRRVARAA
jgi:excisionase family DNA binding protein